MSLFKPLVIDPTAETPIKQLQNQDDLDIPLDQRVGILEQQMSGLVNFLQAIGMEIPDEVQEFN